MKKRIFIGLCFMGVSFFHLNAIEDSLRKKVDPKLQEAEELKQTEKVLDLRISDLNQRISSYAKLINVDVKLTPGRTIFTRNVEKNYVELESYSFIPISPIIQEHVGLRHKIMRLYLNGGQVSKIETKVFEENFYTYTRYESSVIDPSPQTEETGDIIVSTQMNTQSSHKQALRKMENTISRPVRINFKRMFYLKHLTYFEKLFRFVEEFQRRYGTGADKEAFRNLKRSLDY